MFDDGAGHGELFVTAPASATSQIRLRASAHGGPALPPVSPGAAQSVAAPPADAAHAALSAPVCALLSAVEALGRQSPVDLPDAQALAEATALLSAVERLHAAVLTRVADVDARQLHALDGAATVGNWIAAQGTSLARGQVALARRLAALPRLEAAVRDGVLPLVAAERVGAALGRLRPLVDRPDGLIDGQPGEQTVTAVVVDGVLDQVCTAFGGLAEDDPRLVELTAQLSEISCEPTSQLSRLEAAFVLLATHVEPRHLAGALGVLVDALLPNELERRAADGHAARGLTLRLKDDGSGWLVSKGELDLGCGELLHTVLTAELAVDPDNPVDTDAFSAAREAGWSPGEELPACARPRTLAQRRHDALAHALRRLLDSGALGTRDKVAPHLAVTVGLDALHGAPGAVPAVAASGARLPGGLVRRWACDSRISRFVLGLGRRVVETSHSERTLKAHERRAKHLETGGMCQAAGCHRGPGRRLVPHHADPWAVSRRTSLSDTVLLCEQTHAQLHRGATLRLKDGRWLDHRGWTDRPDG